MLLVIAAAILGALQITFAVAYAVLLFSDGLSDFLAQGIGLILIGTIISILMISWFSSYSGSVGSGQDLPTVMTAVMISAVVGAQGLDSNGEEAYRTVIALMSIGALMTAALMLFLGFTRLGKVIRFVPFPVIGGLLAGTGWMLVLVSLNMMTDLSIGLGTLTSLFDSEIVYRWLPGLAIALMLYLVDRLVPSPFSIPVVLMASFIGFHVVLAVTGTSIEQAVASGHLLNLSSDQIAVRLPVIEIGNGVEWAVVWQQMPLLVSLAVIAAMMSLVQVSSIEVVVNQEMDMNREVIANGIANSFIAVLGGVVSYHHISDTALAHRLQVRTRWLGLFMAAICALPFLIGSVWLNWFPIPVLAGLILFLGIGFLDTWLLQAFRKLPVWEYLIVVLIFLIIVNVNFPLAVAAGVVCGIVLFLVRYSRTSVAGDFLVGSNCRSVVKRAPPEEAFLLDNTQKLALLRLKGFLFFGTADSLFEHIANYLLKDNSSLRGLVLDFREVPSIDFTAVMSLGRIRRLLDHHGVRLVASAVPETDAAMVADALFPDQTDRGALMHATRDAAIESLEQHLLMDMQDAPYVDNHLENNLLKEGWSTAEVAGVVVYFDRIELSDGDHLIRSGEKDTAVYILDAGFLEVSQLRDGKVVRLRVYTPSSVLGEMSVYTGLGRTADVIARGEAAAYGLSESRLGDLEREAPAIAIKLHRYFASNLAIKIMDDVTFGKLRDS